MNNLLKSHPGMARHILEDLPERAHPHGLVGRDGEVLLPPGGLAAEAHMAAA